MTKMTLTEWGQSSDIHKLLVDNLKVNLKIYCEDMSEDDQLALLRMNLIMIRQFEEQLAMEEE